MHPGPVAAPERSDRASAPPRDTEASWRAYRDQLLRFVRRHIDDDAAAEDVLQEVFLRMHRDLDRRRDLGNPRAWLYRVTRSVIVDHYRARRPMAALPETLAAPEPDRAEQSLRELARCLLPMIERLPTGYREAVYLSEIEGMTQRRVAEHLGISLSGAKSRVQRGRARLHEMLTECCAVEQDHGGRISDYEPRGPRCGNC